MRHFGTEKFVTKFNWVSWRLSWYVILCSSVHWAFASEKTPNLIHTHTRTQKSWKMKLICKIVNTIVYALSAIRQTVVPLCCRYRCCVRADLFFLSSFSCVCTCTRCTNMSSLHLCAVQMLYGKCETNWNEIKITNNSDNSNDEKFKSKNTHRLSIVICSNNSFAHGTMEQITMQTFSMNLYLMGVWQKFSFSYWILMPFSLVLLHAFAHLWLKTDAHSLDLSIVESLLLCCFFFQLFTCAFLPKANERTTLFTGLSVSWNFCFGSNLDNNLHYQLTCCDE